MSIRIDLRPSRLLAQLQAVQITLAAMACLLLMQNFSIALVLFVPLFVAAARLHYPRRGPRALVLMADEWHLIYDQHVCQAELQERVHCGEFLQILQFKVQDNGHGRARCEWVLILPDSADVTARRKLRTLLRWYPFPATAVAE